MRTYQDIQNAVTQKGYRFFDTGDYNLNIVLERTTDTLTNKFDDFLHVAYRVGGDPRVLTIPATTKPGLNGSGAVLDPNPKGTAILQPGQYVHTWKYLDTGEGNSHYPFDGEYFQQIAPVQVFRDATKSLEISDCESDTDEGIFGINIHKMSNPGAKGFPVNNWSEGCQGAQEPDFKQILPVVRQAVSIYGNIFTATLLESEDFE